MPAERRTGEERRGQGEEGVRWSGQKIGHKINSIQPAECSLLLGSNISRSSPLRGEWVSVLQGRAQQWNPLPSPRCPEPASIHHHSYWKKRAGGTSVADVWGAERVLSRHREYFASSIFRTYIGRLHRRLAVERWCRRFLSFISVNVENGTRSYAPELAILSDRKYLTPYTYIFYFVALI